MTVALQRIVSPKIIPARDVGEATLNLLRNGWTRLKYDTLARSFEPVVQTFIDVTKDPQRGQLVIDHPRELDVQTEPDNGLFIKEKGRLKPNPRPDEIAEGRDRYDETKFTYHWRPRLAGYYGRIPGLTERHGEFFLQINRMHGEAQLLVHEISEELDIQFPGYGFYERSLEGEFKSTTRLLRYLCDGVKPDIAACHRDQDYITVHIRSDRSGLKVADNKDFILEDPEEIQDDSVLIFFGRKMWEITRGRLKGIPHNVIDTTFNDKIRTPRHTAVFFGHASVRESELRWANAFAKQLIFPPHVAKMGM